jgi:cardiolipin synthase
MSRKHPLSKNLFFNATTHLIILAVFLGLQLLLIGVLSAYLQSISAFVMIGLYLLAMIMCTYVSVRHDNPSTKVFWILLIAVFPAFGILLYIMWGLPRHGKKRHSLEHRSQEAATKALLDYAEESEQDALPAGTEFHGNPSVRLLSDYLKNQGFPVFRATGMKYYANGESLFEDCLIDISRAKKTIFMSFFICREGKLWDQFQETLLKKAAEGLDIRILLDDAGTMFSVSEKMAKSFRKRGINVQFFNPTHRYLNNLYLNYRNHQKYIIVDSDIGYTGGVNLSDEYANYTSPLGYWKDTGIRLSGRGVFGMSVSFINMWDQTHAQLSESYAQFRPSTPDTGRGICHVFDDGPYNNPQNTAEGIILRMIETAGSSVFITTPYLAVSQNFIDTLCRVAKSGVRISLLLPWRLDHWYVFEVTRSHFLPLIEAGIEIYRYLPGMLHAKMLVVDDAHALIGSINLDNRSFYIQYEDGVWLSGNPVVKDMRKDIEKAISESCRVSIEEIKKGGVVRNAFGLLLRIFSPMM